jgi:uncharacterized protein YndB with AHSA1/START domain
MKWLLLAGLAIAVLIVVIVVIGVRLPVRHTASRTTTLKAPPADVWRSITDVSTFSQWRTLKSAESLPLQAGHRAWREVDRHGKAITYVADDEVPMRRLVSRIADTSLPFGGSWTYEIAPAANGATLLTITENGEVYNPVFRFVSRFVVGHHATIDGYLADLRKHLP